MSGGKKVVRMGTRPGKPAPVPAQAAAEEWVESRGAPQTKRLTLEIPAELHRRVKSQCAARGTKMIDEITALLDQKFPRQ
jgi:hypothetical protein